MSAFSSAAVEVDVAELAAFDGQAADRASPGPDVQAGELDAASIPGLGPGPSDSLRLLTCGSVDDGKSTLIGRLLWDASDLHDDQRAQLMAGNVTANGQPDFSRLVDGLAAEREQGITIDIAWRFFDTTARRYVIIDSPGHEQYTRNMASGASHADVAILLTDARHGIKRQTRRHAAILDLMGVRRVILAVNKMDLVDFAEERFRQIENDFRALVTRFGFEDPIAIPVAALGGDNVAAPSDVMTWYDGPTLIERLDGTPPKVSDTNGAFRFPVQMVLRDGQDFRGLAGTVASGQIAVGDMVGDTLSGRSSKVRRIVRMGGDLAAAQKGQAVVLELDTDLDIARGAVLSGETGAGAIASSRFAARLVWLSEDAYDAGAGYLLRTATDLVPIDHLDIQALLDLETLESVPSDYACRMNDIALADLRLGRSTVVDPFGAATGVGTFMIVDALTGASVAGGIVTELEHADGHALISAAARADGSAVPFVLDEAVLRAGVCADLPETVEGKVEFQRRAREVARLLKAAGATFRYAVDA